MMPSSQADVQRGSGKQCSTRPGVVGNCNSACLIVLRRPGLLLCWTARNSKSSKIKAGIEDMFATFAALGNVAKGQPRPVVEYEMC